MPRKAAETAEKVAKKSAKKSEVTAAPESAELKAAPEPAAKKPVVRKRAAKPKETAPVAAPQTLTAVSPTHDDIARLAYQLWEQRGRPYGSEQEDWYRAEHTLVQ